jgi:hypothetical protein
MKTHFVKSGRVIIYLNFILLILFQSCADFTTDPDSTPNNVNLKIQILSPQENGTLMDGKNSIIYSLIQPYSIKFIELYVNNVFTKNIPPNNDGTAPQITVSLDSTYVGKELSIYLIYYDNNGTSSKSNVVNKIIVTGDTQIPFKPYQISLFKFNSTSCNISWKDSSRYVEKYELWRKIDLAGNFELHKELSGNSFNVNDNNLDTTKIYFYKVRGVKNSGASTFSDEVNTSGIITSGDLYPPTNLVANVIGSSTIQLNWIDNSSNENYFIVERSLLNGVFNKIAILTPNSTAFKDSGNGLVVGSTYQYRIKSFSNSDSAQSNVVTIKLASNVLLPPSNLTASYNSSVGVIQLNWINNDVSTELIYIERKVANGTFAVIRQIDASNNLYLDFNITTNENYTYRIRGFSSNIFSEYSNEVIVSTN